MASILADVCTSVLVCSTGSAESREHDSIVTIGDADVKLSRCVVGSKVQVELEDGCTAIHTCSVAAAGVISSQMASSLYCMCLL